MKELLFLSHSNPEDNYFASWLSSKLALLGYKVWVDVNNLSPGNYFNRDYEKAIRNDSIRFLALISKNYIAKASKSDSGVMNEILIARSMKNLDNFIIPLKLDDSDYNNFPTGIIGRNAISFYNNWADGLTELLSFFEKENILPSTNIPNVIKFWHESKNISSQPINKEEKYFTNWFELSLPPNIFIYKPVFLDLMVVNSIPFTIIWEGNRIITFCDADVMRNYFNFESSVCLNSTLFLESAPIQIDSEFQLKDPNKKLVKLLNKTLTNHLFKCGLKSYTQSNKKRIFHFPYSPANQKMISLKKFNKGRRAIMGTTSDFTWHFAISHLASLKPVPCFKIFYHIVFCDNHGKYLDIGEQKELRKGLASNWFNRKWFETLLAMIFKISGYSDDEIIQIPIGYETFLKINVIPLNVISKVGYHEPQNEH